MHGSWQGRVAECDGVTRLVASRQRAPLKVAKPFARSDGGLSLCLMDASPGLFNGDVSQIECALEPRAALYLTNQSALALHPSLRETASAQTQTFYIGKDAYLEYFPKPLIPLAGARFAGETAIHMAEGGQAIFSEVITPGRAGRGELFQYENVYTGLSVYWNGILAAVDPLWFEPETGADCASMLGGFTHMATLWILSERVGSGHRDAIAGELARRSEEGTVYGGVSLLQRHGLVVRLLGHSSWQLEELQARICERIRPDLRCARPCASDSR